MLLPGTTESEVQEQMRERADLSATAGVHIVGRDVQRRDGVDPALFVGKGKVAELKARLDETPFEALICNEDLSPRQQRNLERELKLKVVDRTELILDIFAQHARTREGRLQVESAQLHHLLPRLIGAYDYHRQGGGVGTRGGPGEQQIEVERRRIRKRLKDLDRELEQVRAQRDQQRAARRRSRMETVAIVGYTNAGKSTLINALTGAGVTAVNQLFATLDPTTRRLRLPSGREVLLTDTVGFIQHLPTDLVAAFRATLEEVGHADVVLHLVDASSPAAAAQARTVESVLTQLGAASQPRVVALNKIDELGPQTWRRAADSLLAVYPNAVGVSALRRIGLDELTNLIDDAIAADTVEVELVIPYGKESVLNDLRKYGGLEGTEYGASGTRAWGRVPRHAAARFRDYAVPTLSGGPGTLP